MTDFLIKATHLVLGFADTVRDRVAALRLRSERGDSGPGTILLVLGIITLATAVVAGIYAYTQGKLSELGG